MSDENHRKHRKYLLLALFAVFIAILAYSTADEAINDVLAINVTGGGTWNISNNFTNLYPSEREIGVTYWNNQSKPIVLDFNYFNGTAMISNYSLIVNNTIVQRVVHLFSHGGGIYYFIPAGSYYKITNISSGTTGLIYWYEHDLVFTPSIVNNYVTSGGGGVSFDGNPVNMNGTNMFNGTISNYSTLVYTNDSLNGKVNKTGDNLTGGLNFSMSGYMNGWISLGSTETPFAIYRNSTTGNIMSELSIRGNQMWRVENYSGGHKGFIYYTNPNEMIGIALFNATLGERFDIAQETKGLKLNANKGGFKSTGLFVGFDDNITVSGLAGSGNAYVCVDANGKLYRGSPTC